MASDIDRWLEQYVTAWASNEPEDIGALFTDDAEYRAYPWAEPARGRDAVVDLWLKSADAADDHRFRWSLLGADGPTHFVQGRTEYTDGRVYENLWIVVLTPEGRASSFTEWYMESESKPLGPNA